MSRDYTMYIEADSNPEQILKNIMAKLSDSSDYELTYSEDWVETIQDGLLIAVTSLPKDDQLRIRFGKRFGFDPNNFVVFTVKNSNNTRETISKLLLTSIIVIDELNAKGAFFWENQIIYFLKKEDEFNLDASITYCHDVTSLDDFSYPYRLIDLSDY